MAALASACGSNAPAAAGSGSGGTTNSAANLAQAVKFAQCMRDNGVKNFPDPSPDGPIISVNGAHTIPGFQAALAKCSAIYSGQMGLQGK